MALLGGLGSAFFGVGGARRRPPESRAALATGTPMTTGFLSRPALFDLTRRKRAPRAAGDAALDAPPEGGLAPVPPMDVERVTREAQGTGPRRKRRPAPGASPRAGTFMGY